MLTHWLDEPSLPPKLLDSNFLQNEPQQLAIRGDNASVQKLLREAAPGARTRRTQDGKYGNYSRRRLWT